MAIYFLGLFMIANEIFGLFLERAGIGHRIQPWEIGTFIILGALFSDLRKQFSKNAYLRPYKPLPGEISQFFKDKNGNPTTNPKKANFVNGYSQFYPYIFLNGRWEEHGPDAETIRLQCERASDEIFRNKA